MPGWVTPAAYRPAARSDNIYSAEGIKRANLSSLARTSLVSTVLHRHNKDLTRICTDYRAAPGSSMRRRIW